MIDDKKKQTLNDLGFTDEEIGFYAEIDKITRREYWEGFITGAVIAGGIAILITLFCM